MSRAGRFLLEEGLVSRAQLESAALQQSVSGGTIGLHLVRAGVVREGELTRLLCDRTGLEEVHPGDLSDVHPDVISTLTPSLAVEYRVLPLAVDGVWLTVATADPSDDRAVAEVARHTGLRLVLKVAPESEMSLALKRYYGTSDPLDLDELSEPPNLAWSFGPAESPSPVRLEPSPGIPNKQQRRRTSRFRAPAVLEGSYERIAPDELPPDASAGYIPLTKVKSRPSPRASSRSVIPVRSVQVGADRPSVASSPPPPDEGPAAPPVMERQPAQPDIKESSGTWTGLPQVAPDSAPDPSLPASPSPPPSDEPCADIESEIILLTQVVKSEETEDIDVVGADLPHVIGEAPPELAPDVTGLKIPAQARPSYKPPPPMQLSLDSRVRDQVQDHPSRNLGPDEVIAEISKATSRDAAIEIALEYLEQHCRRVALFIVRRGVIEGYRSQSTSLSTDQIKSIWIPLSSPSTLNDVVASREIRIGPVGSTRTDAIFCASLGGRRGDSILVPILVGNRVVSLLYGDDLKHKPPSHAVIQRLSNELGQALRRLVVEEKKRSTIQ